MEKARDLESRPKTEKPTDLVATDVEVAIEQATQVDGRRLNHNVDYEGDTYPAAQSGWQRRVETKEFEQAKPLSLQLMRKGSVQVACSDEGLMTHQFEDGLKLWSGKLIRVPGHEPQQ